MAKALSVSRSNLYENPEDPKRKRGPYTKLGDEALLPYLVEIVDERPAYGYRRVCAVLNLKLIEQGFEAVNHKRVYRIMKERGLLLKRPPRRHETRAHTGKVATGASDQRWCSDGFELTCANGEKVRTIFVLDCCDREVISFATSRGGYTAEMAQSALLLAVEKRFNQPKTGHWIEWLTDNGSCFTASDTLKFAREIGITSCFTPVRSPESNGMAEAFVKTLKRDYANCSALPDARTVMAMLSDWIEDYNEHAPHKGLKWLSPRQFRRRALSEGNFPGAARVSNVA